MKIFLNSAYLLSERDLSLLYHLILSEFQDKAKYVLVEVMKSLLVEMAAQKSKAISLIPGETKSFMTDGDDVLLTNQESG